jgi:hypothetical protein
LTAFLRTAPLGVAANAPVGEDKKDIALALMRTALDRFRSFAAFPNKNPQFDCDCTAQSGFSA